MSIIVGTATVQGNKVILSAPMGFGTARGLRISNFTPDTLILNNISGTDQSQEYIAPQTAMVYRTLNVQQAPYVQGFNYAPAQIAPNILLEWSTDPDSDFVGTYPAALPAKISVESLTIANVTSASGTAISETVDLTNAGPQVALILSCFGTGKVWTLSWLDDNDNTLITSFVNTTSFDGSSTGNAICYIITPCFTNKLKISTGTGGTGTVEFTISRSSVPVNSMIQVTPTNLRYNYTTVGGGQRIISYAALVYGGTADITITANTAISANTVMQLIANVAGGDNLILCDTTAAANGADGNMYAKFENVQIPITACNLIVDVPNWTAAVNFNIDITYK